MVLTIAWQSNIIVALRWTHSESGLLQRHWEGADDGNALCIRLIKPRRTLRSGSAICQPAIPSARNATSPKVQYTHAIHFFREQPYFVICRQDPGDHCCRDYRIILVCEHRGQPGVNVDYGLGRMAVSHSIFDNQLYVPAVMRSLVL